MSTDPRSAPDFRFWLTPENRLEIVRVVPQVLMDTLLVPLKGERHTLAPGIVALIEHSMVRSLEGDRHEVRITARLEEVP